MQLSKPCTNSRCTDPVMMLWHPYDVALQLKWPPYATAVREVAHHGDYVMVTSRVWFCESCRNWGRVGPDLVTHPIVMATLEDWRAVAAASVGVVVGGEADWFDL